MFMLHAYNAEGNMVTLFVKGVAEPHQGKVGFENGEQVAILERDTSSDTPAYKFIKFVGNVSIETGHMEFVYTDEAFKKSIAYDENTGYSSLDGGQWNLMNVTYKSLEGELEGSKQSGVLNHDMCFMYNSAKRPFNPLNLAKILDRVGIFAGASQPSELSANDSPPPSPK